MAGSTIYCPQCGLAHKLSTGQAPGFCTNCGAQLSVSSSAPPTKTPPGAIAAIVLLSVALAGVLIFFLVIKKGPAAFDAGEIYEAQPVVDQEEQLERDCLSNGKQLTIAMLMYGGDNDDVLPPKYDLLVIQPYLKNVQVGQCPKTGTSYSFNDRLNGSLLTNIAVPAETVMFYEGSSRTLSTPHDGKGLVAYTDGAAKMASPGAKYLWDADGSR